MILIPFIIRGLAIIPRAIPIIISSDIPKKRAVDASADAMLKQLKSMKLLKVCLTFADAGIWLAHNPCS
jgi:hypothetical protein